MTITLNRRLLIGLAALTVAGLAALTVLSDWPGASPAAGSTPEQTAAGFARAYYTVDYRDQKAWLESLRPWMTEAGFALVRAQIAPAVWQNVAPAQFVNTLDQVNAQARGPAAEGESRLPEPRAWRIERVRVTLAPAARWPGMATDTADLNVLLEQPHAGGEWQVVATLSDQSVELFKQRGGGQ